MNGIDSLAVATGQPAVLMHGFPAYDDWLDVEEGERRHRLVLLGCDNVPMAADIGNLHIDYERRDVTWRLCFVSLTAAEFRILGCLISKLGAFVPSRRLYDAVHGPFHHVGVGDHGHCNATRVHIKRIRRKFRMIDARFDQIETWYSHGYRWRHTA